MVRNAILWRDVPDPTDPQIPSGRKCVVTLFEGAWKHIRNKHLGKTLEPWNEWLGKDLLNRLVHAWEPGVDAPGREKIIREASAILEQAARASLDRPLVLVYEPATVTAPASALPSEKGSGKGQTWQIVLPVGALLVVRLRDWPLVVTCYFPHEACRLAKPTQRWRKTVGVLVGRFAVLSREKGPYLPTESDVLRLRGNALARRVRFVTPAQWGFQKIRETWVYKGRLPPWADDVGPRPPVRPRLRPRYRPEELE